MAAAGFVWVIIVFEMEPQTCDKACLKTGTCTHFYCWQTQTVCAAAAAPTITKKSNFTVKKTSVLCPFFYFFVCSDNIFITLFLHIGDNI